MTGTSRSNSCDDTAKELVIIGLRIRTNNVITQQIEIKTKKTKMNNIVAGGNKTLPRKVDISVEASTITII